MERHLGVIVLLAWICAAAPPAADAQADGPAMLDLQTRSRVVVREAEGAYPIVYKTVRWDPTKTAVIVCDMWDRHWCRGATARVAEMAPRMNELLDVARQRGAMVIHAPSSCMKAYEDHPARKRAIAAPPADLPEWLGRWNREIATEKGSTWPVDQADGGCNCQPQCAQASPWRRQIDTLKIRDGDAISDSGSEIGRLLVQRNIENVMLVGVHTNMCVIGRPFGLRNMVRFGKNVVLVRDLTDTMYNSRKAPLVPHVRGTELVVEHIEKYVCPSITSSSLLGGPAFRFQEDDRPHVAIIVSDDHYGADETLPVFADELRRRYGCYCTIVHGEGGNRFPAMQELETADVVVLFIRRLALPKKQLDVFRAYLAAGKPLVALRTASHAFAVRGEVEEGHDQWVEFDRDVLGGNYHGHGPNGPGSDIEIVPNAADHPVLAGVEPKKWHSAGSLYFTSPINDDATVLMTGTIKDKREPVTWIRNYGKARVFYTSLGHPDDFQDAQFRKLLAGAVLWCIDRPSEKATRGANRPGGKEKTPTQ